MKYMQNLGIYTLTAIALVMAGCSASPKVVEQESKVVSHIGTTSEIHLAQEMQQMGQAIRQFNAAQTQQDALTALSGLSQATARAKLVYPQKIQANETEKQAYLKDLTQMQAVINDMTQQVEKNDLTAAKQYVQQLNEIKDQAHKRYR